MSTLKEEIENMTHYDPCVRVSPAFIATLMKGILVIPLHLSRSFVQQSVQKDRCHVQLVRCTRHDSSKVALYFNHLNF